MTMLYDIYCLLVVDHDGITKQSKLPITCHLQIINNNHAETIKLYKRRLFKII